MAACAETWRSKLNNKYEKKDIEKWDSQLKAQLSAVRRLGCNKQCFDCGASETFWASPKLGIFICVSCSDVHRAAGAHITCVKNFSTYLWGPDEVALMQAVGNGRGRDFYGAAKAVPSDSKQRKVEICTEKYGTAKVQKLVADQIAAATAAAAAGPSLEVQQRKQADAAVVTQPLMVSRPVQLEGASKARAAAENTDWFDEMFRSDEALVEQKVVKATPAASRKASEAPVPADTADLDDFLAMCNGSKPGATAAVKASTCAGNSFDDVIFKDFANW